MTQREAVHNLACKTAREFLDCAQELGFDTANALVSLEIMLTVTIITLSIVNGNSDHRRYMAEILDAMTENCVASLDKVDIVELGM